jgi:hypothetical protein
MLINRSSTGVGQACEIQLPLCPRIFPSGLSHMRFDKSLRLLARCFLTFSSIVDGSIESIPQFKGRWTSQSSPP